VDVRARLLPAAVLVAAATSLPSPARADAPAVPLVRRLLAQGRRHALADPSGRVPLLVELAHGDDARASGLLPVAPGYAAARVAPDEIEVFAARHHGRALFAGPPRRALLDVSKVWTNAQVYRERTGNDGAGVIVGVIDTGLDVTHPDFRTADGKTRVAWMLRGGAPRGLHPELEAAFGCTDPKQSACYVLSADDVDALIAGGTGAPGDVEGHGTHVASIAAGNGGVMVTDEPRYVGLAPGATLVVAAPSAPGAGFYDPDILNSARFIFDRADAMGLPAVINLSVGGDFGSHDGTSALEKGLAALVGDDHPGRAIVVAAGNSGGLFRIGDLGPYGVHTEAHASPHAETRVPIVAPPAKNGQGYVWITFREDDEVSVGLEAPGGDRWVNLVDPGDEAGYEGDGGTTAAVINRLANGKSAITADTNSAVVAWDGAWEEGSFAIVLRGRGDAQLWVTGTGDAAPGATAGLLFARALKQGTINVPASSPSLLAVGCTVNRLSWTPFEGPSLRLAAFGDGAPGLDGTCYFSSAGPTPFGVPKPEIAAPGAFIAGAMSSGADPRKVPGGLFDASGCPDATRCYVVDEGHAITSGSSMSAPHVAGAVALLFQRDPTLTQPRVTEVLQAGARYPKGAVPYDAQLGVGELDLEGAERALDDLDDGAVPPDANESWYVLSSGYARPDPTWPVWGTIELRREDRTVATGLDGAELTLEVDGGAVVEPLTKVRAGMWRFAVAGRRGTGGGTLRVDVRYAGVALCSAPGKTDCAPRELPIGVDAWAATGGVEGVGGGCTCDAAGAQVPAPHAALAGLAAACASLLRRRRAPA
jgi:subtilisin family serine protease